MKIVHLRTCRPAGASLAALALLLGACASPPTVARVDWLPDSSGWQVRDVDDVEPPRWVLYERDALVADVKEFRIVGLVDAEPAAVARVLRRRLLDEDNVPEGTSKTHLRVTEAEALTYGRSSMPFPFDDREVTERTRFSFDPRTGAHVVVIESIDPGDPPKPGVLRIPLVQNRFVVAPAGAGRSAVTMDTVHDLGGDFLNWVIHGPICDYLVEELAILAEQTAPAASAREDERNPAFVRPSASR